MIAFVYWLSLCNGGNKPGSTSLVSVRNIILSWRYTILSLSLFFLFLVEREKLWQGALTDDYVGSDCLEDPIRKYPSYAVSDMKGNRGKKSAACVRQ